MTFEPEAFWYIRLRDWGDRGNRKQPAEKFGGFDIDFSENENVYTYEQTEAEDHDNWGVVGLRREDAQLLVIDTDCYKIDDFDDDKLKLHSSGVGIVKSISKDREIPGIHFYYVLRDTEQNVKSNQEWVDIKANGSGLAVSPFHRDDYEIVNDELDEFADAQAVNEKLEYDGQSLIKGERSYGSSSGDSNWEPLEDPPDDLPICLEKCLEARRDIPRDGSHANPWKVDSAAGRRLISLGYDKDEAMTLLEQYTPKDGWDPAETSYQLDMLYKKELTPESRKSLIQLGIFEDDDYCDCPVCARHASEDVTEQVLPDEIYTDLHKAGLDADTHATVQGTARSGKTHGITERAAEAWDGERIVCISPTHEEAKAWVEKWNKMGVRPAYLVGEQHARENYDVETGGDVDVTKDGVTPEAASEWEGCNAYQSYVMNAVEADIIVTVPELLYKIEDYDWLIATEEAAIKRLLAKPIPVLCIQKLNTSWKDTDRYINNAIPSQKCQHVIDDILSLEQTDTVHDAILEAARCIIDIGEILEDLIPRDWEEIEDIWPELVARVEKRLDVMNDIHVPEFSKVFKRIQNYNRVENPILNTLYYDGTLEYGNSEGNRKQMFYLGDPDRVYTPIEEDITMWLGGNSIPMMTHFHESVHGDAPEPIGYKNDYEPLRKALNDNIVVAYDGRENANQQSHDIQKTIEQIQQLSVESPSSLIVSGSSEYTSEHAERIRMCTTPTGNDDLETVRLYAENNMCVAIAENSQWSEGVDMPEFQMGAIYNGHFAAPLEEYVKEKTGDDTLLRAERVRAAQNAALRSSNIPSRTDGVIGTGKTPQLVPTYHVPDAIFTLFDAYDINIYPTDDVAEMRRLLIHLLDLDAEEYQGDILHEDDLPPKIKKFRSLMDDDDDDGEKASTQSH